MQLWEEKAYIMEEARAEGLATGRNEGLSLGRAEGHAEGLAEGRSEGIAALILDNLEDGKTQKTITDKLIRHFSLSEEEALQYYEKYAQTSV